MYARWRSRVGDAEHAPEGQREPDLHLARLSVGNGAVDEVHVLRAIGVVRAPIERHLEVEHDLSALMVAV
jgi:hypothetical protein